jgi:hypothetical protein
MSRENGNQDCLTYVESDGKLIEVSVDDSGEIKDELLLTLSDRGSPSQFEYVWVFDTVVVTKLYNQMMVIYEKPIVKSIPRAPVNFDQN